MYEYADVYPDYLMHYGVKGMKWGVIRAKQTLPTSDIRRKVDSTKAAYKQAKKDYNKSYKKAYNYSSLHAVSQFVGKKAKAESTRRWADVYDKTNARSNAKSAYKQAKKDRKDAINKAHRDVNKNTKFGEKLVYNDKTRQLAAKYMVDNNMTMKDATSKANSVAKRNTAIFVGAYAAVTVAQLYAYKKR